MTEVIQTALAIDGGTPSRGTMLPYGGLSIDEDDIETVSDVLRSDWLTTGPQVPRFEAAVGELLSASHAVAFSSGTAALHAAAFAAGLRPGDEAITTPLTFAATANCVVYQGAKPTFADIQADTLNIDPVDIAARITPRTKAILPVDFAGLPADLDPIMSLADKHNLVVIEDACHSLGAEYKGRKLGTISHMTVFSFHPVKHITSGEGGMVLTEDPKLAQRMRTFRHHGVVVPDPEHPWNYAIDELGYNYRITDIQCALGSSQLGKLGLFQDRRNALARRYRDALKGSPYVTLPTIPDDRQHGWHIFEVLLNLGSLTVDRDQVMGAMRGENIGVQLHYPLVHLHPYYRRSFGYGEGMCPVAESQLGRLMTLPIFPRMTDKDQDDVLIALEKVFKVYGRSGV